MSYPLNLPEEITSDILRRAQAYEKTPEEVVADALRRQFKEWDLMEQQQMADIEYVRQARLQRQ